jgi:hypothetical protein
MKTTKSPRLHRETLRRLSSTDLGRAAGGDASALNTEVSDCYLCDTFLQCAEWAARYATVGRACDVTGDGR